MNDTHNITIGLLLVTACILIAALVGVYWNTGQTAAADSPTRGGDYVMVTGAWSDSTDFLYVIDIAARRLNVYFVDQNRGTVELASFTDLRQAFRG